MTKKEASKKFALSSSPEKTTSHPHTAWNQLHIDVSHAPSGKHSQKQPAGSRMRSGNSTAGQVHGHSVRNKGSGAPVVVRNGNSHGNEVEGGTKAGSASRGGTSTGRFREPKGGGGGGKGHSR